MGFSARDVVPFTQARANLSELAHQAKAGAAMDVSATVYLLSIRYYRQLSFDFARLWPGSN